MRRLPALAAVAVLAFLAGCGGAGAHHARARGATTSGASGPVREAARTAVPGARARRPHARVDARALVTAETENRVLLVDLRTGRVLRRMTMPRDPENVVGGPLAVVVSASAGTVTLLDPSNGVVARRIRGFDSPHIPSIAPGGRYAYVTDDAAGTLSVIRLKDGARVATIAVGAGAHHLSASPDGRRLWVALGETARRIVILDASDPARPRVIGGFDPGAPVHDVAFAPGGHRVWVTSATGPDVSVLDTRSHRLLFRVPVGPGPQHVVFAGGAAYVTSGYGSRLEEVDLATGRVLRSRHTPYGSFELDAGHGYVVTSSLLRGKLAVFGPALQPERVLHLAPATRDLAIVPG